MIFNSFSFFIFLACVLILYWKISRKYQWVILLLASYIFYAAGKLEYLGLILITTTVNYFFSHAIFKSAVHKKKYLVLALAFNISILLLFKTIYLNQNFFLPNFNWLLPLGISFYTLQVIGYLIDVYNRKVKPEKHLGIFALFHCFFPQLSAGPIERGNTLLPQLELKHSFDYQKVTDGAKLFTYGLFKKMVIADNL